MKGQSHKKNKVHRENKYTEHSSTSFPIRKEEKAPTKKWKNVEQAANLSFLGRKTKECLMDRSILQFVFCVKIQLNAEEATLRPETCKYVAPNAS